MKMKLPLTLFLLIFLSLAGISQVNCDLTYLTTIENFTVYTHNPSGAILYRAKMAIDADGSPRAYGPNNSGLDWTANAGYPGNWWGIVTDVNGDPVIQGSGDPYPGMYVSTTSLVQSGYATTNPLRYVDSENIPYVALPSALQSLGNISKGDLAYVRNTTNGDSSFAYFADSGPAGKLGEGSMFLASRVGLNSSPKTGGTSQPIIDYVIFPQSGLGQGTQLTVAQIDSMGLAVLNAAGGFGLPGCLDSQIPPLNCGNTIPLTCGVTFSGPASSAQSLVGKYGCNTWTETGPERVHSIIPSANGTITAAVSNYTGDLDVYILGSCDPTDCLGAVSSSSATYTNAVAGVTYYIVVDADDGSGSAYNIAVTCPASTSTEDITLSNAVISSAQVSAGDTVSVSVIQNYSGTQVDSALPAFDLDYYLSTDCNLSPEDTLIGTDDSDIGSDVTSASEGATLIIPANTSTGNYYILFAADNDGELSESDEGNNIVCIPITIDPLLLDCFNAIPLSCGVSYHGPSSSANSNVTTYGCTTWTETGPERIHSIVPAADGTLTATISNFSGDLDVYILGSCDPSDCLGTVSSSSATYDNAQAGKIYYIVVDADDGSGSAYDLIVICPVITNDITVSYTSVSDSTPAAGDTLTVAATQIYYGSQPDSALPAFDLDYYLSSDCALDSNDMVLGNEESEIGNDFPSSSETDTLLIPANTVPGNYYILFSADNDNELTEPDESNNISCIAITIGCSGPVMGMDTHVACESYTWIDGNTYTVSTNSPTYTITGGAANGCDSIVTLNLTILAPGTSTDIKTACSFYTWIDGNTYSASTNAPTYTIAGGASNGCDSIINLDLTINAPANGTDTQAACDSFLWTDGNIYTTDNNTATHTITNGAVNGCDSIVTLNLTINIVDTSVIQSGNSLTAVTVNATYQWLDCDNGNSQIAGETNQAFIASANGNYAVEITENGCIAVSSCFNISGIGIQESSFTNSFLIYPNPLKDNITIDLSRKYSGIIISVKNMLGQEIAEYYYASGRTITFNNDGPAGLYLIEVMASSGEFAVIRVAKE